MNDIILPQTKVNSKQNNAVSTKYLGASQIVAGGLGNQPGRSAVVGVPTNYCLKYSAVVGISTIHILKYFYNRFFLFFSLVFNCLKVDARAILKIEIPSGSPIFLRAILPTNISSEFQPKCLTSILLNKGKPAYRVSNYFKIKYGTYFKYKTQESGTG